MGFIQSVPVKSSSYNLKEDGQAFGPGRLEPSPVGLRPDGSRLVRDLAAKVPKLALPSQHHRQGHHQAHLGRMLLGQDNAGGVFKIGQACCQLKNVFQQLNLSIFIGGHVTIVDQLHGVV